MSTSKETRMSTMTEAKPAAVETKATAADTRSHWVEPTTAAKKADLEQRFESMRARNWITDRMVQQYQRHWHCTREVALERLMAKTSA